jgi:hypothetical protein
MESARRASPCLINLERLSARESLILLLRAGRQWHAGFQRCKDMKRYKEEGLKSRERLSQDNMPLARHGDKLSPILAFKLPTDGSWQEHCRRQSCGCSAVRYSSSSSTAGFDNGTKGAMAQASSTWAEKTRAIARQILSRLCMVE